MTLSPLGCAPRRRATWSGFSALWPRTSSLCCLASLPSAGAVPLPRRLARCHRAGVQLDVGVELVIDVRLPVGSVIERVEIKEEVPSIETSSSTMSAVIGANIVRELPLNARDWTLLANLEPGVATVRTQNVAAGCTDCQLRCASTALQVVHPMQLCAVLLLRSEMPGREGLSAGRSVARWGLPGARGEAIARSEREGGHAVCGDARVGHVKRESGAAA